MSGFFVGLRLAEDMPAVTGGIKSTDLIVMHETSPPGPGVVELESRSAHPSILWPDARADQRTSALTLTSTAQTVVEASITVPVDCRIAYDYSWMCRLPGRGTAIVAVLGGFETPSGTEQQSLGRIEGVFTGDDHDIGGAWHGIDAVTAGTHTFKLLAKIDPATGGSGGSLQILHASLKIQVLAPA